MNYHLIALPSQMLQAQAQAQIAQVQAALNDGTIAARYELLGMVAAAYNTFYGNLGKALTAAIPFVGMPVAQQWNTFQTQVAQDLNILYGQAVSLAAAAAAGVIYADVENRLIADAVGALSAKISAFTAQKITRNGQQQYIVADGFHDTSKIDLTQTTAQIQSGAILLPSTGLDDFTAQAQLWVDDEFMLAAQGQPLSIGTGASNGFPGALHEVSITENTNTLTGSDNESAITQAVQLAATPGQSIAFAGDQGLHADPKVMTDGDATTWFEYEVCNIPDTIKYDPCQGYGFTLMVPQSGSTGLVPVPWYSFHDGPAVLSAPAFFPPPPGTGNPNALRNQLNAQGQYQGAQTAYDPSANIAALGNASFTLEPVSAPSQGGTLRLVLLGEFAQPALLTQIAITPRVLNNKPPMVAEVSVRSADASQWIAAHPMGQYANPALADATSVAAPPPRTQIWAMPQTNVSFVRIVLEQSQPYSCNIGHFVWVSGNQNTQNADLLDQILGQRSANGSANVQRVDGPNPTLPNILKNVGPVEQTIEGIASTQGQNTNLVGPLLEAFPGWRYAIAVEDIAFQAAQYASTGVLVSQEFQTPVDIKSVALQVDELVPEINGTFEWITYEISFDGGSHWTKIAPQSHLTSSTARKYDVNPLTQSANTIATTGYDPVRNPASSIRLRATLSRPSGSDWLAPRLLSYSLILEGNPL